MRSSSAAVSPREERLDDKDEGLHASGEEQCEATEKVDETAEDSANDEGITEDEIVKGDAEEFSCRPDDGEQAEKVRQVRTPRQPTKTEVEEHDLTHCPPRSWCEHCMRGQAKDDAHVKVTGGLADSDVTRVILDYCFFQEGVTTKTTDNEDATKIEVSLTALVMVETLCHSVWAYAVSSKGAAEAWVSEQIVEDLETIGLAQERIITKADQEASITDVQRSKIGRASCRERV